MCGCNTEVKLFLNPWGPQPVEHPSSYFQFKHRFQARLGVVKGPRFWPKKSKDRALQGPDSNLIQF